MSLGQILMPLGHFSVPVRTKFGNEPEFMKFRADSDFTRHYY